MKKAYQPVTLNVVKDIYDFYVEPCPKPFYPDKIQVIGPERMATEQIEIEGQCTPDVYYAGDIVPDDVGAPGDNIIEVLKVKIDNYYVWVTDTLQEIQALLNPCCIEPD